MRLLMIVLSVMLITLSMNTSAREIQKWTDAEGKVHYGDFSESKNAKSMKVPDAAPRSQRPVPTNSTETRKKLLESMTDDRKKKQAKTDLDKKNREIAKKNCSIAKSQMHMLQAGGRKVRFNDKGEREYLSDNQINSELAEAKKNVSKYCK